MFSAEQLENIDSRYFNIITADAYDVTIMSRNTGHIWYIHNPEYPLFFISIGHLNRIISMAEAGI